MTTLDNSRRALNRATYTPIKAATKNPQEGGRGRAIDKASALRALAIRPREIPGLRQALSGHKEAIRLLGLIEGTLAEVDRAAAAPMLNLLPQLAAVDSTDIVQLGEALIALRSEHAEKVGAAAERLQQGIAKALQPSVEQGPPSNASPPKGHRLDASFANANFPAARLYRYEKITAARPPSGDKAGDDLIRRGETIRQQFTMQLAPPETVSAAAMARIDVLSLSTDGIGALASSSTELRASSEIVTASAQTYFTHLQIRHPSLSEVRSAALAAVQVAKDGMYAFGKRLEVEPVGYLHLERIGFTPAGIERGELVHSVPLSPGESVNISHKEWSNTSEEFERIVTDYQEIYSEEGVAEKSELTQATSSQQQHSSGFNMSVSATGGYGPVSITASAGYNVADSASTSQQFSRNQSSELTRKASARTKKEHKISFKVASASGTEDQAVRQIKNPFADRATRADYYQLIRKWRVDLFRYGVRLTYDLTIPEPGSEILSKIIEIRDIQAALGQGFGAPGATQPWARFDLAPAAVTRSNYLALASLYGAAVETPPANELRIVRAFSRQWASFDESKRAENNAFDVEVPADYFVQSVAPGLSVWAWEGHPSDARIETDVSHWVGASGRLTINVFSWQLSSFTLETIVIARLKPEVLAAWQMRTWGTLRDAALARYESNRANLKARLAQLQEELGSQDALSLRKIEREEVTKGVLRWLFGPDFEFVPPGLPANLYDSDQVVATPDIWAKVTAQGEIIKFLHHAIEWENMLYFLYPYFWSHTSRWELKKFLDHPDFMHRTFLRAGSARVVLTLRPGFERDFMAFIDGGVLGADEAEHYMTIAQEMEAYAKTNYPGIRPANPVEDARPLLTPMQRRAWDEMQAIIGLLERHKGDHGAYPTTTEGLAALAGYGSVPSADPWGRDYVYRSPGRINDFELLTYGADGVEGGEGEDADINSWAEASLIGRWYEYTPTSALDIGFDEILPSA